MLRTPLERVTDICKFKLLPYGCRQRYCINHIWDYGQSWQTSRRIGDRKDGAAPIDNRISRRVRTKSLTLIAGRTGPFILLPRWSYYFNILIYKYISIYLIKCLERKYVFHKMSWAKIFYKMSCEGYDDTRISRRMHQLHSQMISVQLIIYWFVFDRPLICILLNCQSWRWQGVVTIL